MKQELYIYGSENPKDNGKMHIADENGKPLCGTNIKWGECTAEIVAVQNGTIYSRPFGRSNYPACKTFLWEWAKCLSCEKNLINY